MLDLTATTILEYQFQKYNYSTGKAILVPRYCIMNAVGLHYYKDEMTAKQWMSKPIGGFKISQIE